MALVEWLPPTKKPRVENATGCTNCGLPDHTVDTCPFASFSAPAAPAAAGCTSCGLPDHTVENCPFANLGTASTGQGNLAATHNGFPNQTFQFNSFDSFALPFSNQAYASKNEPYQNFNEQDPKNWYEKKWTKTQMCRYFEAGMCKWGNGCSFAHGTQELNTTVNPVEVAQSAPGGEMSATSMLQMMLGTSGSPQPVQVKAHAQGGWKKIRKKTEMCKYFEFGMCKWGSEGCGFAHGAEELNTPIEMEKITWKKTELCKYYMEDPSLCKFGSTCGFAHGEWELNTSIAPEKKSKKNKSSEGSENTGGVVLKTELCKYFDLGMCKWGDGCSFAHGAAQLNTTYGQVKVHLKTELCKYFDSGMCKWGDGCSFAHGAAELNTPINNATALQDSAVPAQFLNASFDDMVKVVEESANWLTQAAAYCTATPGAADISNVIETAGQAVQRIAWAAGAVMAYEQKEGDNMNAADIATKRHSVLEAKQRAETAHFACTQVLQLAKPRMSLQELSSKQSGPEIVLLSLTCTQGWAQKTSQLAAEGYHSEGVASVHLKGCDLFSDASFILQSLLGNQYVKDIITIEHDAEATEYPEIFEAWKAQGGGDWPMTVAKCRVLKKWGAGFGGRKDGKGDKAAKLSLALCLAGVVESSALTWVVEKYPDFGKLMTGGY